MRASAGRSARGAPSAPPRHRLRSAAIRLRSPFACGSLRAPLAAYPLRLLASCALGALLVLAGCATPRGPQGPKAQAIPASASPDLLFLIGQELEHDGKPGQALKVYEKALAKDPKSVYLLKEVAQLSARMSHLRQAVVYGERALQLAPNDTSIRLFLGTLYRFEKDPDAADRVLRNAKGEPIDEDAAALLYGVLSDAKRYAKAKELAQWMIDHDPDSVRGWLALADATEKLGDPAASEKILRQALAKHPKELVFYAALARSRRERGDRVGEIEIYDEVLARHPRNHVMLLAKADAQIALGRKKAAMATLEQVERYYPDDLRTRLRIGFLDYELGNYAQAERRFSAALAAHPEQYEVAYFLGVVERRMEKDAEAIKVFEGIPADHERYADARAQIAAIYERQGDYARALAEVNKARAAQPSRALDLYAASLRARTGDVKGALASLQKMLAKSPRDAEILYNIGVIHGEAKDVDEAIHYMKLVLGIDPNHAGALNYVGYTWAERGEHLDQAEAMISKALQQRPDDGYITDSLGWVYYQRARPLYQKGNVKEGRVWLGKAIDELERASKLTGGDPVVSEHLGDAYLLMGRKEKALQMYEKATKQDPRQDEQPDLPKKLESLRRELGSR